MPNAPKTPLRSVRIHDELWNAAIARAELEGLTVTGVIRASLYQFVTARRVSASARAAILDESWRAAVDDVKAAITSSAP